MNLLKNTITILCLISASFCKAQSTIIPFGNKPIIDGVYDSNKWNDAFRLSIKLNNGIDSVNVYLKHNDTTLFIAFKNNLQSKSLFPEVLIDPNNDQSSAWLDDDWWLHASATDCYSIGKPSNYDSCKVVQKNWKAMPNMPSGPPTPPLIDYIEFEIPFTTVNLINDDFGIAFDVTNTFSNWNYWPTNANIDNPSSWQQVKLGSKNNVAVASQADQKHISINLNYFDGKLHVHSVYDLPMEIIIYNLFGNVVYSKISKSSFLETNLSAGYYLYSIKSSESTETGSLYLLK